MLELLKVLGLGGKDLYRQARAVWRLAQSGDARAQNSVAQLDAGTKTIYAAYKDLRRRDRFSADFRPTPYDVWSFRHDRAFGITYAGNRFPPRSLPMRFTTTPVRTPLSSIPWRAEEAPLMFANRWAVVAWPMISSQSAPRSSRHDIRQGFPVRSSQLRSDILRPAIPHDACAAVFSRRHRDCFIFRMEDVSLRAFDECVSRRFALAATLPAAGCPDREGSASRFWLSRSRLFRLFGSSEAGFQPERRISCPMEGAYCHSRRAVRQSYLGRSRPLGRAQATHSGRSSPI